MTVCIRIEDYVYDAVKLAKLHPGGEIFVLQCSNTDGTAIFNSSHRRRFPHDKYKDFRVDPAVVPASLERTNVDYANYFELCQRVSPLIPRGGWAPWTYFVKAALLLGAAVFLDCYMTFVQRTYTLSAIAGIIFGFIGLNVQHDANHGAVSRHGWVNRLLGLSQDYIGGNGLGWMVSHNVVHHVHCNDCHRDHDLDLGAIRLKTSTPWQAFHRIQHFYFLLLELAFSPVHISYNIGLCISQLRQENNVLSPYWRTHRYLMGILVARFGLGLFMAPSMTTFYQLVTMYMIGGFYLSFFFLLSHNFENVAKDTIDSSKGDFVTNQAITSSNVGGSWLAQMNGGLNFQIEHHLFPRVHHSNYATIAPVVRQFCKEKKIAYVHFPTVWDNFLSTASHLKLLGKF